MKLGKREIDGLACPPGRRDMLVFDEELPGFALRVTSKGAKTFLVQYRQGPKVHRLSLGTYGTLTPAQARKIAMAELGKVAAGNNPAADRRAKIRAEVDAAEQRKRQTEADTFTFETLIERWADLGLKDRSAIHQKEGPRAVRACFDRFRQRPAHSIQPVEVQKAIDAIAKTRPMMARRSRDYARAMYNWAIKRRLLSANPFAAVVIEGREVSRDRVLSDNELAEAWQASAKLGNPFGPFIRLVILTLQRRGEVAGMTWDELAPDLSTWTIPAERSKNGKGHIVHLPEAARSILRSIPRQKGVTLVFTTTGRTPVSAFSRAMDRLEAAIEVLRKEQGEDTEQEKPAAIDWRLHDFRRTGVTVLARQGFAPHVADRLLNHIQGSIRGVAAVYQRHDFLAEREAAAIAWAAHVLAVGDGQGSAENVVALRPEAARAS